MTLVQFANVMAWVSVVSSFYMLIPESTKSIPNHIIMPFVFGLDIAVGLLYLSAGYVLYGVTWFAIAMFEYYMMNRRYGGSGGMKHESKSILPKWVGGR